MGLTLSGSSGNNGDGEPIHWPTAKAEVLRRLDVIEEYIKLGVKFPNLARGGKDHCWVACHAVGREDNIASAAVHCENGTYVDKGGDQKAKDFFKFVAEFGPFGSWFKGFDHYAKQVNYAYGRVERSGADVLEARHEYRDAAGERRYACYRYRLPNGSKRPSLAKWVDGRYVREKGIMEGVEPLPYRLPDLLETYPQHDFILWCEGEQDVDRAYDAGLCASTSHMGGKNWPNTGAKFLHLLPAHDYVVVPDNDEEGRAYAAEVADALKGHFGSEATVKVVPLPGVPYKGSVGEYLDLVGTADDLRALIAAAPAWEPGQEVEAPAGEEVDHDDPDDPDGDCSIQDLAKHVSDAPWAWHGWIPSAALTLLASEAGAGKTRLMMDLHRRAFYGLPWPDGQAMNLPPGRKTLWIVADNHHEQMVMECKAYGLFEPDAVKLNTKRSDVYGGTTLVSPEQLEDLEARIRRVGPYWVVIDTITNTGDFKIQDAVDAKRQYKPLQEIAQRTKTPIVCVTHTNASGKVLGRRAIEKVRTVVLFSEPDRGNQPDRRRLWVEKSFALKPPALGVTVGVGAYEYDDNPPEEPEKFAATGGAGEKVGKIKDIAAWLEDVLGAGTQFVHELIDMAEEKGFSRGSFYHAKKLLDISEIEIGNRKAWQLNFPD